MLLWELLDLYYCCGRQEEPAILISKLLLRMRRMYVASNRLDFHLEWIEWMGLFWSKKLEVKFSGVFIRFKDTHWTFLLFFFLLFPLWMINEYLKLCLKKKIKKNSEWKTYLAGVQNVVDVFKEFFDNNLS